MYNLICGCKIYDSFTEGKYEVKVIVCDEIKNTK